jgi:hypothetical protein
MNDSGYSRRAFLATGLAAPALAAQAERRTVDYRKLLSPADLVYEKPVPRSEEGIPVGNGRMGSLVWTTPTQVRMQINRVDVYANNCATNSFFERHNDYCGGCAYLGLDFGVAGDPPFPETGFPQRLSLYDGLLEIEGKNVAARIYARPSQDVMAAAIRLPKAAPGPVTFTLRMLRSETKYYGGQLENMVRDHVVTVQNRNHTAASRLHVSGPRIALTQEFREGSFFCQSAVAIAVAGRDATARFVNETDVAVTVAGAAGEFTVLIASAASFDTREDVLDAAMRQIDASTGGFEQETLDWWHQFWARGLVQLDSADGSAEFVAQNYHYYLYIMAASSRGKFPPKFNGMIWNTGGDLRTWGAQHWFANLSCYYEALPASGRLELMDPMFQMYFGMYGNCATAARQQWGSQGMYIPETSYFDGLEKLPDEIGAEMQDLYLLRKPWEQRSAAFLEYARNKHPHSSRWNWIQAGAWVNGKYTITERGSGPYGAVSHIYGTTAKVAYLFWRRYEFTLDRDWLRDRAYPMLRGAVEFYRNHPNVNKGADGKYHIHWANSNESIYGARDTDEDMSAMRGVTSALLRAAEILTAEPEMQPVWGEFLDNLAPLPLSDTPEALKPDGYAGPRVFVRGLKPAVKPAGGLLPDANSLPMWFFDLCNVESRDRATLDVAAATFNAAFRSGIGPQTPCSVLSKLAIAGASLGRADAVRYLIPNQMRVLTPERSTSYKNGGVLANRMTLREGPQALDAQRLGRAAEALHLALLQSNPPAPGEDPILHLFPAWPKEWNARYSLLARGAFQVSASMQKGRIESVEILSHAGAECRLRNPFAGEATLYRNGAKAENLRGDILRFTTRKGETVRVAG